MAQPYHTNLLASKYSAVFGVAARLLRRFHPQINADAYVLTNWFVF